MKATLNLEIEIDYDEILKRAKVWEKIFNYKYDKIDEDALLTDYLLNFYIPKKLYKVTDIDLIKDNEVK